MAENRYCIDYAKRGTAGCKKCKAKIQKGMIRIAKLVRNPFSDEGDMKQWFHPTCIFEQLKNARASTKKIDDPEDLEGWSLINPDDQELILQHIKDFQTKYGTKSPRKISPKKKQKSPSPEPGPSRKSPPRIPSKKTDSKDDSLREFRRLCAKLADEPSYNEKTKIVADFFSTGTDGKKFKGDLYLWVKMLLPGIDKRVYNLQSKQIVKLFSQIFDTRVDEMIEDLEQGDVAETIRVYFEDSASCSPAKKSTLTLQEVDESLEELTKVTKEDDQRFVLNQIAERCTSNDLKIIIRLIKHDLRINSGPKHILEALHPDAYNAFQTSRNLKSVIEATEKMSGGNSTSLGMGAKLMTPVLPMLAQACKSTDEAFKKCSNGVFVETKYDGERIQVHKDGTEFKYFSRSLKPVLPHKVEQLKEYIPKAFPAGNDLILDSEVLLMDTKTSKPLPFGTLGKHKKTAFTEATVCLFVFDCIYYNGKSLMEKPFIERRNILKKNMTEIKNHIMLSEITEVEEKNELEKLMMSAIDEGLEGLVLKDKLSLYEPGKRHWLKMKKDYLAKGAMADSADLVVLGAYYGTGKKGGIMSTFLMGCYNPSIEQWCTVTKVSGGHDDATLKRLQDELDMVKISRDFSRIPDWLNIHRTMVPDFVSRNPKNSPVWEITGAEFSKSDVHTADGKSIRFPRVTRIRDDKSWKEATNLQELQNLFNAAKKSSDIKPDKGGQKRKNEESDTAETNQPESKKSPIKKNLPDIFSDVKLHLPFGTDQYELLRRYFIAYDGDLLGEHEEEMATHQIVDSKRGFQKSRACPVTVDWLWDSIKLQKQISATCYKPG